MKTILLILTALLLAGCTVSTDLPPERGVQIVRVRNCEYVRIWSDGIVHAADCSNAIHRGQQ